MYRNRRHRPLTPLGCVVAPLAFCFVRVGGAIFNAVFPEKTKYAYRVDGKVDAENPPQKNQGGYDEVDPQR